MATETAWAVTCREHGTVYLTEAEYDFQLEDPDRGWSCPRCGKSAEWDDDNFEKHMSQDDV